MRGKISIGVAAVLAAATMAGCSSSTGMHQQAAAEPTATAADSPTGSAPTSAAPSTTSTPAAPATTSTPRAKPVSALLAHYSAPITTNNMPKASAAWVAAVQKTTDDGTALTQYRGIPLNLMALVDEAAKTSDLDALIKLCDSCAAPAQKAALTQAMTQTDSRGQTGFAQLSFLLEHTHPAQPFTQSGGGDFPGFTTPQHALPSTDPNHAALTGADESDMKALGVSAIADYKGLKVEFMNLNDGPNADDGWIGLVPAS